MYWLLWRPYTTEHSAQQTQGPPASKTSTARSRAPRAVASAASRPERSAPAARTARAPALQAPDPFQESVSRLLNAFDDQAICVFASGGRCLSVTPHWEALTGHTAEHSLDRGFMAFVHDGFRDKLRHRLVSSKIADTKGNHLRCQIRHADRQWHWWDFRVIETEGAGEEARFTCLLRRVTQAVQTEKKLARALAEAEVAHKSRSEFLANMSHELRTPLNAILGFSQIMENQLFGKIGNSRYLDYLGNVRESGQALLDKINDLLEISHIDSGRATLKEEVVDLAALVHSAMEIHSHHAFSKRVTMRESLSKTPLVLRGDRVRLKQAISNLLSNALSYNQAGGSVLIESGRGKDGSATLTITDTGQGIGPKQIREIHNALQQEDSFFERQFNGVGLGLALAKEYIALHGGVIRLESKQKQGCKVTVSLPKSRIVKTAQLPMAKSKKLRMEAG